MLEIIPNEPMDAFQKRAKEFLDACEDVVSDRIIQEVKEICDRNDWDVYNLTAFLVVPRGVSMHDWDADLTDTEPEAKRAMELVFWYGELYPRNLCNFCRENGVWRGI